MNRHLTPQHLIEALDGVLDAPRQRHLEACEACRSELAQLQAVMADVASASGVPEPSPLFWSHFSDRVRHATNAEPVPASRFGWIAGWQTMVALAAAVALVLTAATVQRRSSVPPPQLAEVTSVPESSGSTAGKVAGEDGSWDFIMLLAADLPSDELHPMAASMPGAADVLASNLSLEQRRELVRLLKAEMGGTE